MYNPTKEQLVNFFACQLADSHGFTAEDLSMFSYNDLIDGLSPTAMNEACSYQEDL